MKVIQTNKEIIDTTIYKAGYEIRTERWTYSPHEQPAIMRSAYSPQGDYIGDPKLARRLIKKGIKIFETQPDSLSRQVCIGYAPESKMWYGWSHRAIVGFGPGNKIFDVNFGDDKTLYKEHGAETIVTLEDAKRSALAFASHVS